VCSKNIDDYDYFIFKGGQAYTITKDCTKEMAIKNSTAFPIFHPELIYEIP
jgi:hypothetical protein